MINNNFVKVTHVKLALSFIVPAAHQFLAASAVAPSIAVFLFFVEPDVSIVLVLRRRGGGGDGGAPLALRQRHGGQPRCPSPQGQARPGPCWCREVGAPPTLNGESGHNVRVQNKLLLTSLSDCLCFCLCLRACVRACVGACVRASARAPPLPSPPLSPPSPSSPPCLSSLPPSPGAGGSQENSTYVAEADEVVEEETRTMHRYR